MTKQLQLAQPAFAGHLTPAPGCQKHAAYCLAGQPAELPGYFEEDLLPCVCGLSGTVLQALDTVAVPVVPIRDDDTSAPHQIASVA